ncbi:hypothetical protein SAMN04488570_2286 [Nocardioides scoriae]|uniref:Phosphatase n=1 Tax=Nocardioides scoriae TaxID=642780 RepID=A0A1H1TNF0_9ACTN|nr:PhoX family phosphatase [Nocardioides scoriae]SDS61674.1 hypothetical protein SAMN04488570_2286 [Nocardioides scoriae]
MTQRTLLPLFTEGPHGSRSAATCHYRCADACFKPMPNTTDNPEFHEVAARALARRSVLKAGAAGLGALAVAGVNAAPAAAASAPAAAPAAARRGGGVGTAAFTPVKPNRSDRVVVPRGYRSDVVVKWGDRLFKNSPEFDVDSQTPQSAALQFGYNNDYVGVLPTGRNRAQLVTNHEYTDENLMFPTGRYDSATIKKIAIQSHGMSVVDIRRGRRLGSWEQVPVRSARGNRRITGTTVFTVAGPAAGEKRLRTAADPTGRKVRGTFGNCAGGTTPWGTVLSGEENFNGYFDKSGELDARYTASYARYGLTGSGSRGWSEVDPRFDLSTEPHEPFRFGWIVEVDPSDPSSSPRKQTMLGRFKHEGANVAISRGGRAVAYMGDDERGDYIYKFVSARRFDPRKGRAARRRNLQLLTEGTLYVAKFTGDGTGDGVYDGTGQWIPLTSDTKSFVPGMSVADVLIDTRLAADKVGPTKMDRPEDIEPNPVNGKVYCALTNNSNRGTSYPTDEANPLAQSQTRAELGGPLTTRSGNRNGYVLEISPGKGDHAATTFTWDLMLVCGDPDAPETYFAGYPKQQVSPISCPDNVAFDAVGNLWISTDGNQLGSHDGLFRVPVSGAKRGHVEQFLTVPTGAETCGPLISADQRSVFIAVQHPGETDGATFENPSSTWPGTDDFPRPAVVVNYLG